MAMCVICWFIPNPVFPNRSGGLALLHARSRERLIEEVVPVLKFALRVLAMSPVLVRCAVVDTKVPA